MVAVSQKIPNLLGGVSQQPDPVKLPGQVRAAENVYLDPTFGCRKRPGTDSVATLATNVPADARWFPIFRDNDERYAVAIYTDPSLVIRVWDLNDGSERTVTLSQSATAYMGGATQKTIEQITIADYTLIANTQAVVSMNTNTSAEATKEALVTIDQVAYNATYSIDLANDGVSAPTKVYSATGVEVIPGSYEEDDGGVCSAAGAQTFTQSDGAKSGLIFRIVNQCQAYLTTSDAPTQYKVESLKQERNIPNNAWYTFDPNNPYAIPPDRNENYGSFTVRWRWNFTWPEEYDGSGQQEFYEQAFRNGALPVVVSSSFSTQVFNRGFVNGNDGGRVYIDEVRAVRQTQSSYRSRYKTDVQLRNGGVGWREGDTTTVTMNGKSFTVRVTGDRFVYAYNSAGSANFTTPADTATGVLDIGAVVGALTTGINAITDFSAESVGNVIKISNTADRDFNLSTRGGITNKAMTAIKGIAQDIAELPAQCFDGFIVKVNNTEESDSDDYYVKFEAEAAGIPGAGSWTEVVAPGIKTNINSSTMPHALIRQADGSFTVDALNTDSAFGGWAPRDVGDETTNPEPTFVNRSISNMFFFANRLGFLSEDAVIMSQPGDYFNFFATSALTISDADPIDLTASSTTPAILKAAIGSPKGLILFAERSQFLLSTTEISFAASTVKMTEISQYFYKSEVLPLSTGVSVAFISENQTYSKVMEMAIDSVENRPVVAEITRIIPEYLPPSFVWGEVSPNNNMMLYGANTEDVYIFKFFNNGDKRELAGWTRWTYPAACHMFAMEDDLCHIILFDGTKHMLVRSELIDDPQVAPLDVGFSSFSPRLDLSVPSSALTITDDPDSILNSRVAIPDKVDIFDAVYTFISTDGGFKGLFTNSSAEVDSSGNKYIVVSKDLTSANAILGIGYDTSVTLPSIFLAQEGKSDRVNIPQVSFLYLELYYSGRYEVTVEKLGYEPKVYDIEVTPANSYDANNVPLSEISTQSIPIFSSGDILDITIKAPDPFPSSITGYSWEGTYNNRGIRALG